MNPLCPLREGPQGWVGWSVESRGGCGVRRVPEGLPSPPSPPSQRGSKRGWKGAILRRAWEGSGGLAFSTLSALSERVKREGWEVSASTTYQIGGLPALPSPLNLLCAPSPPPFERAVSPGMPGPSGNPLSPRQPDPRGPSFAHPKQTLIGAYYHKASATWRRGRSKMRLYVRTGILRAWHIVCPRSVSPCRSTRACAPGLAKPLSRCPLAATSSS